MDGGRSGEYGRFVFSVLLMYASYVAVKRAVLRLDVVEEIKDLMAMEEDLVATIQWHARYPNAYVLWNPPVQLESEYWFPASLVPHTTIETTVRVPQMCGS